MKAEVLNEWVTLIQGDCLEAMGEMDAGTFDAVVTDPPYGISRKGSAHVRKAGKGSRQFDFLVGDDDWAAMAALAVRAGTESTRVLSTTGSMYWWIGHRQIGPLTSLFEAGGFSTRFLVWSKACPVPPPPGAGWASAAELCLYAYRPGRKWRYTPMTTPASNVIVADSYRHGQPGKVEHPTQKPFAVVTPLILASTDVGDVILDCFAGSGTVGVAAMFTGRKCVLVEKDPRYCDVIRRRVERASGDGPGSLFHTKNLEATS